MNNIHTPRRQPDESLAAYRRRRATSQRIARSGHLLIRHVISTARRKAIKAAGGARQFKRQRYLAKHEGYAAKHPVMAARVKN